MAEGNGHQGIPERQHISDNVSRKESYQTVTLTSPGNRENVYSHQSSTEHHG